MAETFQIIPTFSDPYYDATVSLLDKTYLFRFRYNTREETWLLSILRADHTEIVNGIKLVAGADLLEAYRYNPEVPQGALQINTQGADDGPPGLEDLGIDLRCELTFVAIT